MRASQRGRRNNHDLSVTFKCADSVEIALALHLRCSQKLGMVTTNTPEVLRLAGIC